LAPDSAACVTLADVLFAARMRGLIRDWNRYWSVHPERWYADKFDQMQEWEQKDLVRALERVRCDMNLIMNGFRESR